MKCAGAISSFSKKAFLFLCLAGLSVSLLQAGQATGGISGRVTDGLGTGLANIKIGLYDSNNSLMGFFYSDGDGYYSITGLSTALFKIYFDSNGQNFISEWYNHKTSFAAADSIAVTDGVITSGINFQMIAGGQIKGKVTDPYAKGLDGISVFVFMDFDLGIFIVPVLYTQTTTNADGDYAAWGLPTGGFKLSFADPDSEYLSEYYNDKSSWNDGDYVDVTAGGITPNINVQLAENKSIALSKSQINFGAVQNGTSTPADSVVVSNSGIGTLAWTATPSADWLSVSPGGGAGNGVISIGITRTDMMPGTYSGTVLVSDPTATNSPQSISVLYKVFAPGNDTPPFGYIDRPFSGTTVASSIPVTGWALDDLGVQSVKIYRGTDATDRVFLGEATIVEGARPDVTAKYGDYPQNERAGWGYMLLTNLLPNGGNGPVNLLAYATDWTGQEALLGSSAIICDNANAIKPFGAIDTPTQGGTASGSAFLNFGWALTPMPNTIPIDGSTLTVWVDSLPLGHPVYNNYRADIATLFPGYANSNGAVGYYYLNTTGYADGIHTIEWSATDTGGNTDGIGSRYFAIQNAVPVPGSAAVSTGTGTTTSRMGAESGGRNEAGQISDFCAHGRTAEEIAAMPEDARSTVFIKRGLAVSAPAETVLPDNEGITRIEIPEVTRLALYLNESDGRETETEMIERGKRILSRSARNSKESSAFREARDSAIASAHYEAYQLVDGEIRSLPIGASFDPETGAFYWQPGPGFRGDFRFVIIDSEGNAKKTFCVRIL